MRCLRNFLHTIDEASKRAGEVSSILIYVMTGVILYEVILRYGFNSPTDWGMDVTGQLLAAYIFLGGADAIRTKQHVNMDLFLVRLSTRAAAIVNLFTYLFALSFSGILFVTWVDRSLVSVQNMEVSNTPCQIPVYPVKVIITVAVLLVLLQMIATYIREVRVAITNRRTDQL